MKTLTNMRPLLGFSLAAFRSNTDWDLSLYNLRCRAEREDGWFLLRCKGNESYAASFQLEADDAGRWMLGKIESVPSRARNGALRFDIYLFGGSRDLTTFCIDERGLLASIRSLDELGMESLIADDSEWESTEEDVFTSEGFTERPQDVILEMMFGGESWVM